MQNLLEMPEAIGLVELKAPETNQANIQSLPLLDAELLAAQFPCFDLSTEVRAHTSHSSGGGYTSSTLAQP